LTSRLVTKTPFGFGLLLVGRDLRPGRADREARHQSEIEGARDGRGEPGVTLVERQPLRLLHDGQQVAVEALDQRRRRARFRGTPDPAPDDPGQRQCQG
jgi:hypothetical protein